MPNAIGECCRSPARKDIGPAKERWDESAGARHFGDAGRLDGFQFAWRMVEMQAGTADREHGLAIFAKQAIVDRAGKIYGHELLFRDAAGSVTSVTDHSRATMTVIEAAMGHVGLNNVSPVRTFFLNCSAAFLMSPVIHTLPVRRFVLEILETCELDRQLIRRCEQLKSLGFRLALDDVRTVSPDLLNILPLIDIVKVDWPYTDPEQRDRLIDTVVEHGKMALAEKIETVAERACALASGCALMQGFYFSRPQVISKKKVLPDLEVVTQLIQALLDEASLPQLAEKIERSPGLCVQLLHLANSCIVGNPSRLRISSIAHAVSLAGTQMLLTWCALQLYQGGADATADPLTDLARQRADRISDWLASRGATAQTCNKGRLVGLLSLLHISQGVSAAELWRPISFEPEIKRALVLQEGLLGNALIAATKLEQSFSPGDCVPALG
ncbi:EAL and HDOD domain-containing protein [Burkholderia gladioli]|uniref:EAL and HDOD domain-containing protein n=1 Tax=Burkholderia gladioli TaxID=28095 RepID=UPI001FC810C6|nr:EAL domain-containing protein [Burkholderia gladioli]